MYGTICEVCKEEQHVSVNMIKKVKTEEIICGFWAHGEGGANGTVFSAARNCITLYV